LTAVACPRIQIDFRNFWLYLLPRKNYRIAAWPPTPSPSYSNERHFLETVSKPSFRNKILKRYQMHKARPNNRVLTCAIVVNALSTFDESPRKWAFFDSGLTGTPWQHRTMIAFRIFHNDHPNLTHSPRFDRDLRMVWDLVEAPSSDSAMPNAKYPRNLILVLFQQVQREMLKVCKDVVVRHVLVVEAQDITGVDLRCDRTLSVYLETS